MLDVDSACTKRTEVLKGIEVRDAASTHHNKQWPILHSAATYTVLTTP